MFLPERDCEPDDKRDLIDAAMEEADLTMMSEIIWTWSGKVAQLRDKAFNSGNNEKFMHFQMAQNALFDAYNAIDKASEYEYKKA